MSSSTTAAEPEAEQPSSLLIPSLPDDVAINCLARVPLSQHPTLRLVSKAIRSLLSSPHFFNTRSLLPSTHQLLYLCLHPHDFDHPLWYILHHSPTRPLLLPSPETPSHSPLPFTFSTRPILHSFPQTPYPPSLRNSAYVVLGHSIYVIGGYRPSGSPSSEVWILDCRLNSWIPGSALNVARDKPIAGVIDGKIYVLGGCEAEFGSDGWAEVLDPASDRWEKVAAACPAEMRPKFIKDSAVVENKFLFVVANHNAWEVHEVTEDDGKVFLVINGPGGITFDPRSGAWESVYNASLPLFYDGRKTCVVDGVLYCGCIRTCPWNIKGFDLKSGEWKMLKGLEGKGLPNFRCTFLVANVGGKLVMVSVCDEDEKPTSVIDIYCAEIEVTRNEDGELWGEVCWCNKVLSVPDWFRIVGISPVAL